jgi:hypothetical protein
MQEVTSTIPKPHEEATPFPNPERAAQIFHILIAAARHRQTMTYKLLAEMTGAFPANLGYLLGYIMRWCELKQLPPLTVLVVQTGTGRPGPGLSTTKDQDADRERVFDYQWYRIRPPLPSDLANV